MNGEYGRHITPVTWFFRTLPKAEFRGMFRDSDLFHAWEENLDGGNLRPTTGAGSYKSLVSLRRRLPRVSFRNAFAPLPVR